MVPVRNFLARLTQQADLNKAVQISMPRMSFEMTSIQYDSTRKSSLIQTFKTCDDGSKVKKVFMPVPYNIGFELNILSKLNDDSLQILEQDFTIFSTTFQFDCRFSSVHRRKERYSYCPRISKFSR